MAKILLLEDDTTFATILEGFLKKNGHDVDVKYTVRAALDALSEAYELLILDYRLGDGTGLDIIDAMRDRGLKKIPAIMMTSFNDVRTAVHAIRRGVFDYITKPVNPDQLLMVLNDALAGDAQAMVQAGGANAGRKSNKQDTELEYVQGESAISEKLHDYIQLVAPTDMSILIRGESGTGKEYVASSIHAQSKRADKPFVSIDCGTLSKELAASELFGHVKGSFTGAYSDKKGQFEQADGGTLFLDEIGNLSYDVQVKLLRALQERVIQPIGANKQVKVDVRVIAATNDDLLGSASHGKFREDLYHRINEFEILVPALRERGEDLGIFVQFFLRKANEELDRQVRKLSPEVERVFRDYDWPGNLRELRNIVKRMVLLTPGHEAQVDALPNEMVASVRNVKTGIGSAPSPDSAQNNTGSLDLKSFSEAQEKQMILDTLKQVKYNKSKAAQLLNIDRKTLYNKLDKYDID